MIFGKLAIKQAVADKQPQCRPALCALQIANPAKAPIQTVTKRRRSFRGDGWTGKALPPDFAPVAARLPEQEQRDDRILPV